MQTLEEMDQYKVQVHNIGEERSVGLFSYDIRIKGKKNVETSRKMILYQVSDLLKKQSNSFPNMRS